MLETRIALPVENKNHFEHFAFVTTRAADHGSRLRSRCVLRWRSKTAVPVLIENLHWHILQAWLV
jgi:hypothetical protein